MFKIGDAFPASNPVAVFLVALSGAFNDLLVTNIRMLGGDDRGPERYLVAQAERLYLLRVSFSQLHELRQSIKHAGKDPAVAAFIGGLADETTRDLALVQKLNPTKEAWVGKAMTYVRNQTLHYGGKWGWDAQQWALTALADEEGEIVMTNHLFSGMRLSFADLVAVQHFTRLAPEYVQDPNADPDPEVLHARIASLFAAASTSIAAALRFVPAALNAYFDSLPPGVITEPD